MCLRTPAGQKPPINIFAWLGNPESDAGARQSGRIAQALSLRPLAGSRQGTNPTLLSTTLTSSSPLTKRSKFCRKARAMTG